MLKNPQQNTKHNRSGHLIKRKQNKIKGCVSYMPTALRENWVLTTCRFRFTEVPAENELPQQ